MDSWMCVQALTHTCVHTEGHAYIHTDVYTYIYGESCMPNKHIQTVMSVYKYVHLHTYICQSYIST